MSAATNSPKSPKSPKSPTEDAAAEVVADALERLTDEKADTTGSLRKEVTAFLKTFASSYISSYSAGLVDQIIEEQSQAAAEDGQQPQEQDGPTGPTKKDVGDDTRLKHRPMTSGERPTTEPYLKTRAFKRGQINKSWKERYLVLRTDWVVEYYISQEVYDAGGKPKGCMHLEGYTVVRDPNGRKVEAKKALRQQFGIEGDVTYSKYEPLVLECFHPVSRRWLIRLSNQAEFDAWAHMLEQATLRARSRVLTDPIAADAFRITFERLREPLVVPSEKSITGTEQNMLAELLFLHVEARYLKAASGKLNLTPAARLKVHIKYRDFVKSTITSLVAAQWKTINGTLSATREQLKKGIAKVLVPARKAKDTVSEKVSEKTAPVVDPLRNNLLAPAMQPLSRAVAKALVAVYSRFAAGFQRACDAFVAAASAPGADVELCERRFAVDVAQPGTLRECFEELNKLAELCSNVSSVLPDSVQKLLGSRLKMLDTGFDASGYIRRQERAVLNLADAAAYTFAESFKTAPDRRPATVTALREDTLKRFYVEAADNVADGTQDFCADAVDDVFALRVLDACGPLVSGLDSLIPAHVRQFISVRGCLEAVLSALVASAAKTATEKVMQEKELVKF